ncbi:MAG: LysM peptidoglycan-binding domain-containing protein [Chloroflexi bacterium]|nr:MAG: LysM peptidoglycan-binding domain-containing protein [Chloroflexota bacterium]
MKNFSFWMITPLLVLTFALIPSERVDATPQDFSFQQSAVDLIDKVNALRESKGLPEYTPNSILMKISQEHAGYLARTGVLTHFDQNGLRPFERAIASGYPVGGELAAGGLFAEAIHSGTGLSEDDVIAFWQADADNSRVLLSPEYKDAGAGIAAANGVTYFVLVAGSGDKAVVTTVSPEVDSLTVMPGTVIPNTPLPGGEIYHIVQKDEALWSIAIAYNTTIAELKLLNSLSSDEIFEGQKLLVRRASTETPTPTRIPVTVTLGIPTSTATRPVTPTATQTSTPLPSAPTSLQAGGKVVGGITLAALVTAGLASFLLSRRAGNKKSME